MSNNGQRQGFSNKLQSEIRLEDHGLAKELEFSYLVDQLDTTDINANVTLKDGPYPRKFYVYVYENDSENTTDNLNTKGRQITKVRII